MRPFPRPRLVFDAPPESRARPFVLTAGGVYSLDAGLYAADAGAEALRNLGVVPGDRVAVLAPVMPEAVCLFLSIWRAGAVVVPVSTRWPPGQVATNLRRIGVRSCIHAAAAAPPEGGIRAFPIDRIVRPKASGTPAGGHEPAVPLIAGPWPRDATIVFTSGSAGSPKAVVHTFGNHFANAFGANAHIAFGPGDVWLLALPLYHVGGFAPLFRALAGGGAIAAPGPGMPLAASLSALPATHCSLVSTQLRRLLDDDHAVARLAAMKLVLVGGAETPRPLVAAARTHGIPIATTYGSSELASQVATGEPGGDPDRMMLLPYRRATVAPEGELLFRGLTLCRGYAEGARVVSARASDSWFHSGDLGTLDAAGRLTVTGRTDAMFIAGGENVHPEEIERALAEAPGMRRALVVPVPDPEFGARPVAFIDSPRIDEAALRDFLGARIARFKIPRRFLPWPEGTAFAQDKPDRAAFARLAAETSP